MAEYGAHITLSSLEKPSIFDVVAQESLLENLYPAYEHAVKILIEKYPNLHSWVYNHIDKVYFLLHGALQHHYLSNYGASFAENFYDLKRTPLKGKKKEGLHLESKEYIVSLATLTLIPYIKHYLAKQYREEVIENNVHVTLEKGRLWKKLRAFVLHMWPSIHFFQEMITLVYYIRYLTGHQRVQSPFLHVSGVALARLSEDDYEYIQEKSENLMKCSQIRSVWGFCRWSGETLGYCLQNSLEVGAFFLQFLDWFYNNNSTTKNQMFASGTIPPPPQQVKSNSDPNTCPICFREIKQETVLSVSGYVFCYACILPHVREHGSCPVTQYPATTKQLVRIFHD